MKPRHILVCLLLVVTYFVLPPQSVAVELNRPGHYQVFSFKIDNTDDYSLHWNPPSNFIIYDDGYWFLYAEHVANMQRIGGFFDTGDVFNFGFQVTYYNDSSCNGFVVHEMKYHLANLNYKEERWNMSSTGTDSTFANVRDEIKCARYGVDIQ